MPPATRTVNVRAAEPVAAAPAPIATLRPPERMPRRRAPDALTISRAAMLHCVEQAPASLTPRLAIRAGLSFGRSAIERDSDTEPATAANVAFAPRLRPRARRTFRLSATFTPPEPAPFLAPP